MPSLHPPFFSLRGACLTMRGAAAPSALPEASRQTWLLPPSEGAPPLRPQEFMRGWQPLRPPAGAPREHGKAMLGTQGDFPDAGKSPKARQGLPPLDPAIAKFPPSLLLRCACTRAAFCHNKRPIYHFKLSGQIGLLFLPKPYRGHTSCCQSVARQGHPRGCLML